MIELRSLEENDIGVIAKLLNNARVARYLSTRIPFPYSIDDAKWWVTTGCKEGINKAIDVDGNFVGMVGVTPGVFENKRTAEIGYWIGEKYWGHGIATEAVAQMTESIFQTTDIVRLFAPVFSPNTASTRVLEKCGYYHEVTQKKALFKNGEIYDAHIYAKLHS